MVDSTLLKLLEQAPDAIKQHPLLGSQYEDINRITGEMSSAILDLIAEVQQDDFEIKDRVLVCRGPMSAGKTTITKQTIDAVLAANPDIQIYLYAIKDGRGKADGNPSEMVFARNSVAINGQFQVESLSKIEGKPADEDSEAIEEQSILDQITQRIKNGMISPRSVLFLTEAQFMGSMKEISELLDAARNAGIILVCDSLSRWFTGRPIEATSYLHNLSTRKWEVEACDSFDETRRANTQLRCTRVYEDGSFFVDPDDQEPNKDENGAHFLREYADGFATPQEFRLSIIKRIEQSRFASSLIKIDPKTGRKYYLIPSHPEDRPVVYGGDELYKATSVQTILDICRDIGLENVASAYEAVLEA